MKRIFATKKGKIIFAAIALLLIAAIAFGCVRYRERQRYFCQYARPFSYSEVTGEQKPVLVAHRGAAVSAPENTLPAYRIAAQKGYTYVETDVRATADGVWVIMHDNSLKRMTGGKGKVESMTLAEVQAQHITKGANIKAYPGLEIPTLEDFLALCIEENLTPVIEIKTNPAKCPQAPFQKLLEAVECYGLKDKAVIISFYAEALERIRSLDADIPMQLLTKTFDEAAFLKAEKLGNCAIDCEYKEILKNKGLIPVAKSAGIPLNAWTVDSQTAAQQLVDLGIDYITTNAIQPE